MDHDIIINTCMYSNRESIIGLYFYDVHKKHWFKILKSEFIYTAFSIVFDLWWCKKYHKLVKVRSCNKKQINYIKNCDKITFNKITV